MAYNRYIPKKPSKRKINETLEAGQLGVFKTKGTGRKIKGVDKKKPLPRVVLGSGHFKKLNNDGFLVIGLPFTEENRKMFHGGYNGNVLAEHYNFEILDDIECKLTQPPYLEIDKILLSLEKINKGALK